jgi:hypothetical protein
MMHLLQSMSILVLLLPFQPPPCQWLLSQSPPQKPSSQSTAAAQMAPVTAPAKKVAPGFQ